VSLPLRLQGTGTVGSGLGKTAWVDQALLQVSDALSSRVDWAWLPKELDPGDAPRPHSVVEYGCGSYGCVMPTNQQGLVLKLTSDGSEAWFAYQAMELAKAVGWPKGIVRYRRVIGLRDQKWKDRQLYLLWRDEARQVGRPREIHPNLPDLLDEYMNIIDNWTLPSGARDARRASEARTRVPGASATEYTKGVERFYSSVLDPETLGVAREFARTTYDAEDREPWLNVAEQAWRYWTPERDANNHKFVSAVQLLSLYGIANDIEQLSSQTRGLGATIRYYLDQGLLLKDLHQGNVGLSLTGRNAIIVDPGLVEPLRSPWFTAGIPKSAFLRA
jgi:hypothetical protein